jgi:hypothetical protein
LLLQPPCQRQREKNFVNFCMIWKYLQATHQTSRG